MKKLLASFALVLGLTAAFAFSFAPHRALAYNIFQGNSSNTQATCKQGGSASSSLCSTSTADPLTGSTGVIHKVTVLVARIAGAIAIIMVIVGGFMFVTSNGDSGKVKTARETIIYAAIGLVVIIMGQTIIIFVIDRF